MMGGREERKKEEEGARGWVLEGSSEPTEPPAADEGGRPAPGLYRREPVWKA